MFDIVPARARFADGQKPMFIVKEATGRLALTVFGENRPLWHGVEEVDDRGRISLGDADLPGGSGYLLQAVDADGRRAQTGFDISTDQVRYGFLSDFDNDPAQGASPVGWLNRLHVTDVQFYDWAYRHDRFIAPTDEYTDMMGKKISRASLRALIDACHDRGMHPMAYGAVYGSSNEYAQQHPADRVYDQHGEPVPFFDLLSIMNVDRSRGWHDHILGEYQKALDFGFDGIHVDTYGTPLTAYDDQGCKLDLARDFRLIVDDARARLHARDGHARLIFNNVKNWPVDHLATAHQDALYIEVWDPYSTYKDILRLIEHARSMSDLPIILAAYLPQFIDGGAQEDYDALALLTAIITVAGATHLVNGENRGILTQAYYSKYFTADAEHARRIAVYYDYITYFAGLWADRGLRLVPLDAGRRGGKNIVSDCAALADLPEPGRIWIRARRSDDLFFVNLVNLTGSHDPKWTHGQNVRESEPFVLRVRTDRPASSVTYSTPDGPEGIEIRNLDYDTQQQGEAVYTCIHIPRMRVWGTVLIRL